jgi:membrane glycosyltransferase
VTPIVVALMLSVPVSVLTSRVRLGDAARRLGLFLIPEETAPPAELCDVQVLQRRAEERRAELPPRERDGFVRAVVDPWVNALHRVLLGAPRSLGTNVRTARAALVERALAEGPESLGARERRILLRDPALVDRLHEGVWALADRGRAACWGRPGAAPASPG